MKFEFAKYTDITELAFKVNPQYENDGYVKFYICNDVWDFWFVRILEGYNEDYEQEEGIYLIERNNIQKERKSGDLTLEKVKEIIEDDDGSNWDILECYSLEDAIDNLDDGFGIN